MTIADTWYACGGSGGQGLVIEDRTGASIAVTYDAKHAPLVAAAPEMLALLERMAENCRSDQYVERLTIARDARALVDRVKP